MDVISTLGTNRKNRTANNNMSSTKRIENYKSFDKQLEIIRQIDNWDKTDIILSKKNEFSTSGKITKQGKKINIEIKDISLPHFGDFEKINGIEAKVEGFEYLIDSFHINSTNTKINETIERTSICELNIIKDKNFKTDKSKYQCFISTEVSKLNTFHYQFETVTYQDKETEHFYDCLRIDLNDVLFDIVQLKNGDKGFYIIDSLQEIELESFQDYCFSIKQALGLVTTHMPGGEELIFTEEHAFYYCNYLRPEIDSMYSPLNWNPYSILYDKKEIAESYMNKLTRLKLKEFSTLVSMIHNNQELSASIILLIEASSVRSFLIIPSVFSVVVESLSKIISHNETGKEYPISHKATADSLKKDLTKIVDSYNDKISNDGILKIKRRINEINRPIVKEHLTNNQKLTLPFEQVKVELTIDDIKAIEHRNDLLHGNILMTGKELKSESDINNYMGYISGKLFTLISALIFKYVGYEGYIINHAKFYEDLCEIDTNEEYFRLI
ncbi:hypothetical protein EMN47_13560 [Prolixibacteraceae bacterium JC049]|nr:hypothetical protein [Prolixibacteraceae bacterium JC049]